MKIGTQSFHEQRKFFLLPVTIAILALATGGAIRLTGQIWADEQDMTTLWFSNSRFCSAVSVAITESMETNGVPGKVDGRQCTHLELSITTSAIGNIETLNILPPDEPFVSISGDWTNVFYNLSSLSITDAGVEDISPLRNLRGRLTYLNLSNNQIYDVTPLYTIKDSLTYLDLSGNPVGSGLRELSESTSLQTLNLSNTGVYNYEELFQPAEIEYDENTGEPLTDPDTSSNLAKVLQALIANDNSGMSNEKEQNDGICGGNLASFETYADDLAMTELYVARNDLNADDLICISALQHLVKLDVSENHIDDFSSIKTKAFTSLKADSQLFTRAVESLDYSPLPTLFEQVQEEDFFEEMVSGSNDSVMPNELTLINAQFNGDKVRFIDAAIASMNDSNPRPATVMVPAGTGVFENSRLEVYFAGQVVTFNDANLCNSVYNQGASGVAFIDSQGNSNRSPDDPPIVLTNACSTTKQIAMVSDGSSQFLRLTLRRVNNGAEVDLTGLEEFPNLQVLDLRENSLTDISKLSNAYSLLILYLNDNNLEYDDWFTITNYLINLGLLDLTNNQMSSIPTSVEYLTNMQYLYLANNGISDVSPLGYLQHPLEALDLSDNNFSDFSGLAFQDEYGNLYSCNPATLMIENSGVTSIPSAATIGMGFSRLENLNLNDNQITSDTISNLAAAPRLRELHLDGNQIDSTSGFGNMSVLSKLFLDSNQITEVSGLTSLTGLAELHLKDNQIGDITGLNTMPALSTLDLTNQTLIGSVAAAEEAYVLPAVFSQATTLVFPNVSGFQSAGSYIITNGTIDYDSMSATMTNATEAMTVTIPDGGLAGTKITVTYVDSGSSGSMLHELVTNLTNGGAEIEPISETSFMVMSEKACMVLWTQDNGTTWTRLASSNTPEGYNNARIFNMNPVEGMQIMVAYAGDVNSDANVNVRDARKIVSSIIGSGTLSSMEEKLADVDGRNGVNIRDARAIINNIMGAEINW